MGALRPLPMSMRGAASGGARSAAEGVAEFAHQDLDGAAGAAGQVLLPVALGLEAAVAQAVGPGLHGLAWALGDVAN